MLKMKDKKKWRKGMHGKVRKESKQEEGRWRVMERKNGTVGKCGKRSNWCRRRERRN